MAQAANGAMYCIVAGSEAGGDHHDAVVHGAIVSEDFHHLRDSGAFLPDRAVDTNHVFAALVDDGVQNDSGLAGLAVADNQLALAATDGDHGVNGFDAGLKRLAHGLAIDHAGSNPLEGIALVGEDGTFAVERLAERVHHAADQGLTHGDGHDGVGALDGIALSNLGVFAEKHGAHLIFFQVQRDAEDAVGEGEHLAGHNFIEAVDAGDSVADRDDRADFIDRNAAGSSRFARG